MRLPSVGVLLQHSAIAGLICAVSACTQSSDAPSSEAPSDRPPSEVTTSESDPEQSATGAMAFERFEATSVTGHDLVAGTFVIISAESNGENVSVNAGCNTLIGTLDSSSGVVSGPGPEASNGPMASTKMMCEDALMQQDQWLQEFLDSAPRWIPGDGTVTLRSPLATIVADRIAD